MIRENMLNELRTGVKTVTFTKLNGEERVMDCTLNMELIPIESQPKTDGNVTESTAAETTIKVYDVKAEGWRSFKVDSVKNFA